MFQDRQWLVHGAPDSGHGGRCLDTDGDRDLFVSECKEGKASQKWKLKNTNEDRVKAWNINKV